MNCSPRLVMTTAIFVTCLITANIITVKATASASCILPAAIIVFPLSDIFGDVLTHQGVNDDTPPHRAKAVLVPSPSKK